MATAPVYLHPSPRVHTFVNWLLHHASHPTLVVVCSDRSTFLEQLEASTSNQERRSDAVQDHPDEAMEANAHLDQVNDAVANGTHPLLTPTLLNISKSRYVKLAFVASIPALLAYLTTLPYKQPSNGEAAGSLMLLGPLALHKDSSSWSAQGLGRSVALAAETAREMGRRLTIVECIHEQTVAEEGDRRIATDNNGEAAENFRVEAADAEMADVRGRSRANEGGNEAGRGAMIAPGEPWSQRLPVVAPGTRTFGVSDRAWSQKTISAGDVVRRWCVSDRMPDGFV